MIRLRPKIKKPCIIRSNGRINMDAVIGILKSNISKNKIGRATRYSKRFDKVLTITRTNGLKFGFLIKSRLLINRPPAEFMQLLNQLHGSKAQKRKTG
ncbi:MAG: hypothetical protein WBD99_15235 [Thermodesulfobacteriota bacterium]